MYSGLSDTLVHIVEGYISTKSTNVSKYFSKLAFDLFQENVFKVIHGKANSKNYLNLQWASSFAMIGMSNSSHGISGALSYYLGTHYGVNHGIAGGFFLRKICKIFIPTKNLSTEKKRIIFQGLVYLLEKQISL